VNERDRGTAALTPIDQGSSEQDISITQRIRKEVVSDDSLSMSARNVKIITRNGHVTLRGTVKTRAERASIEQAARNAAGPQHVTNEIEVSD
jgi:hyperosmotically inducible periplasmic protein